MVRKGIQRVTVANVLWQVVGYGYWQGCHCGQTVLSRKAGSVNNQG